MMTVFRLKVYMCIQLLSKNSLLCVLLFKEILDILDAIDILDILVRLSLLQHVLYERFSFITTPHKRARSSMQRIKIPSLPRLVSVPQISLE
jgi:hypothetical protein